jgi:hypothetical protein
MKIIEVPAIITHLVAGYGSTIYEVEGGAFHTPKDVWVGDHWLIPGDEVLLHFENEVLKTIYFRGVCIWQFGTGNYETISSQYLASRKLNEH